LKQKPGVKERTDVRLVPVAISVLKLYLGVVKSTRLTQVVLEKRPLNMCCVLLDSVHVSGLIQYSTANTALAVWFRYVSVLLLVLHPLCLSSLWMYADWLIHCTRYFMGC